MTTPDSSASMSGPERDVVNRPKQYPRKAPDAPDRGDKKLQPDPDNVDIPLQSRPGDTGVGRPRPLPRSVQPVDTKPKPMPRRDDDVDPAKFIHSPKVWAPSILRIPIIYFGGILIFCLIGIWLLKTGIELIDDIAQLPTWLAYASASLLIVLLGIVIGLLGTITVRYIRLPYRPQLVLRQIVRAPVARYGAYNQARVELSTYLRSIDCSGAKYVDTLKRAGLSEPEYKKFITDMRELVRDRAIDGQAWLNEYQDNIQSVLNSLAARRQRHYAAIVGLKTAISPWKAVDMISVLYNNTMLVRDLCALANRRVNAVQSLSLLAHVGFNTFIASEAQDFAGRVTDRAVEDYQKLAQDIGLEEGATEGAAEGMKGLAADGIKSASRLATAKLGEGLTNAWLTKRFGTRVWSLLTPLRA